MPLPALPGYPAPMPSNFGNDLDPNSEYARAVNSVAATTMLPDSQDQGGGVFAQYIKRGQAQRQSARPAPGGYGQPVGQGIVDYGKQQAAQVYLANVAATQRRYSPEAYQQPPGPAHVQQAPQSNANGGYTLGDQFGGGRNVEVIRGGHSQIEHLDQSGNTGVLQPLSAYSSAQVEKPQSFNQANEQAIFQYREAERQANHLDTQIREAGRHVPPELIQQRNAAHQQMAFLGKKIGGWSPEEGAAAQREQAATQEVAQAAGHVRPPQEQTRHLAPGDPQAHQIAIQILQMFGADANGKGGDPAKAAEYAKAHGYSF